VVGGVGGPGPCFHLAPWRPPSKPRVSQRSPPQKRCLHLPALCILLTNRAEGVSHPSTPQDRWLPLEGVESGWLRLRLLSVPGPPEGAPAAAALAALAAPHLRGSPAGPLLQVLGLACNDI
jgi:hypothetical protein